MKLYTVGLCLACMLMFEESTGSFERPKNHNNRFQYVEIIESSETEQLSKNLLQAATDGEDEVVKSLVTRGANVNFRGNRGITSLIAATENKHRSIVEYLLYHRARVNVRRTDNGYSSLMIACQNNDLEMVKLLLRFGADVDLRCDSGFTSFDFAMNNNNIEILMMLLTSRDGLDSMLETIEDEKTKLLFYSVVHDQKNIVNYCVEDLRVDVNSKGGGGETPLILTSRNGYDDIAEYLLSRNAGINEQMNDGSTALMFACIGNFQNIVKMLIERDVDVNCVDTNYNSPLIFAVNSSSPTITRMLIEAGAKTDQRNNMGEVPFSIAVARHRLALQMRKNDEADQWQQIINLLKKPKSNFNGLLR